MSEVKDPRYIPKYPPGEDAYTTKPHETIAEQVAEYIKDYKEQYKTQNEEAYSEDQQKDKGKEKYEIKGAALIGLEGKWGSGKSNLIRILENNKELKINGKFCVFTFDAWAFQEDLNRRTFLLELTDHVIENEALVKDVTEKTKEIKGEFVKLFSKEKTTSTRTYKKIGVLALLLLVVTVATPFIERLLSEFEPTGIYEWTLFICSFGILTLLVLKYGIEYTGFTDSDKSKEEDEDGSELEERLETTYDNEKTLKDYRQYVADLSEAIGEPIVIVFDNMDRLPKEKIEKLWSLIHTFFSEELNTNEKEKAPYPVFGIVPFDRAKLSEAMHDDCSETTSHYLDKTFSIIYPVVEPILTDWKKFFRDRFGYAFGQCGEECDEALRVYEVLNGEIQPRSMINYINEIVRLKTQWRNEIDIFAMSVYTFFKEKEDISNFVYELPEIMSMQQNSSNFIDESQAFIFDDKDLIDLMKSMTALIHNLSKEEAIEKVVYHELEKSISQNSNERVKKYFELDCFSDVLDTIMTDGVKLQTMISNLISALDGYEDKTLWSRLSAMNSKYKKSVGFNSAKGIVIKNLDEGDRIVFIEDYFNSLRNNIQKPQDAEALYFHLYSLDNFITEQNLDIQLLSLMPDVILRPSLFIHYCMGGLTRKDITFELCRYKVKTDENELNKYLKSMQANVGKFDRVLNFIKDVYNLSDFFDYLQANLRELSLVSRLKKIGCKTPYSLIEIDLSQLKTHLKANSPLLYDAIVIGLRDHDGFENEVNRFLNIDHFGEVESFLAAAKSYMTPSQIRTLDEKYDYPLLKAVAKKYREENPE